MIWLALLMTQAVPAPAVEPEPETEVVVVGERLKRWKGRLSDTIGIRSCKTVQSTGDAEIDRIGCRALGDCYVPLKPRIVVATRDAGRDEEARKAALAPIYAEAGTCVKARRTTLIAEFVAARRGAAAR